MIAFIDDHRAAYGAEPICRVLPIAPSTYHAHVAKRADSTRLSSRARRDDALKPEVERVFDENFRVYGVRKVWREARRPRRYPLHGGTRHCETNSEISRCLASLSSLYALRAWVA
jgi:hypothetical protein